MIDTRAGAFSGRTGSPGACGTGSHTNVTFVLPSAPRSDPIHVRTTRARDGVVIAAIAESTAFGGIGLGGASARAASSARERPVALSRTDLDAGTVHLDLDLVKLAVRRR